MAPKREPSIKKSPSGGTLPRLGPPFPCPTTTPTPPKPTPELKPRLLRPSDSPFDPSTLEFTHPCSRSVRSNWGPWPERTGVPSVLEHMMHVL
ncbi:hypothetical protein SRHO_G00149200 [Serrasalmus rhombeus]